MELVDFGLLVHPFGTTAKLLLLGHRAILSLLSNAFGSLIDLTNLTDKSIRS